MQNGEEKESFWMFWKKRRYLIGLLLFFGTFLSYNFRVSLSVAIVKMTENRTIVDANGTVHHEVEFDWDSKKKGFILSAFFYGYISTQLIGGWLAARIGGKWVFGLGIAVAAFLATLVPPIARYDANFFIALRVIQGFFEGVTYPTVAAIWANWAPPLERSKLSNFAVSGCYVGTFISLPVCGVLAEHLGWASIFYVFGGIGLFWFLCWTLIVQDRPENDSHISQKELTYIKDSLKSVKSSKKVTYPWRQILSSAPVWAIYSSHVCESWGYTTMMTQLPIFLNDVLGLDLEQAGVYSALPYVAMTIMLLGSGFIADNLHSRAILTTTQVRKIMNTIGFVGQGVFMILAACIITQPAFVIPSIILAVGFGGIAWSGFNVNYLEIAPRHASIIAGIGNTLGCIPAIISPISFGYIVQNKSPDEWRIVFLIVCSFYAIGSIVYAIFASGELQPWAVEKKPDSPRFSYKL